MKNFSIGIDVGGTFTDLLLIDLEKNSQLIKKVLSTPQDPSEGVINGLSNLATRNGITLNQLLEQTKLIVHGTTVATNAVLTETGAKTSLVTTEGFRDVLQMRRGVRSKEHLYDNQYVAPKPLVPRYLIHPANERTLLTGEVIIEVTEEDMKEAAELFKEEGITSVAICFMHSYANALNERKAKEYLSKYLPDAYISISTDVASVIRLYNRVSTVTMNSYVGPILKKYINKLVQELEKNHFSGELLVMQSNGGVTSPVNVVNTPASTVLSGPAGGPVAGSVFAKTSGFSNAIIVDMGGTSFEASIIKNGEISLKKEGEVKRNLIALPMAEIHSIGSGGGSIAWIDQGGLLKVGPQSASSLPGPACYDKGGELPTCSDADLVLGYLNPTYFLGGGIGLNLSKAREAIEKHIAIPLNMSVEEAALGIYEISNINMANGIKEATVMQGHDPRDFPLIVAGGAGPVHAAMIAQELGIKDVIIPSFSSVLCAVGMLASNLRHDYVKTYNKKWLESKFSEIIEILKHERVNGLEALSNEGVKESEREIVYGLDMRYVGQHYEITIEVPERDILEERKELIEEYFHLEHERLFGYSFNNNELEIMNIRLTCKGIQAAFKPQKIKNKGEIELAVKGSRSIYDPILKEMVSAQVYDGEKLSADIKIIGPSIIELTTTTIVVPNMYQLKLNEYGNFIMNEGNVRNELIKGEEKWIQS